VGDGRERKGSTARVVRKAHGETVSSGAKEAADINMVTHLLHAPDRERMREATDNGALMGMLGLSKIGWWGRENLVVANEAGDGQERMGSTMRVV